MTSLTRPEPLPSPEFTSSAWGFLHVVMGESGGQPLTAAEHVARWTPCAGYGLPEGLTFDEPSSAAGWEAWFAENEQTPHLDEDEEDGFFRVVSAPSDGGPARYRVERVPYEANFAVSPLRRRRDFASRTHTVTTALGGTAVFTSVPVVLLRAERLAASARAAGFEADVEVAA